VSLLFVLSLFSLFSLFLFFPLFFFFFSYLPRLDWPGTGSKWTCYNWTADNGFGGGWKTTELNCLPGGAPPVLTGLLLNLTSMKLTLTHDKKVCDQTEKDTWKDFANKLAINVTKITTQWQRSVTSLGRDLIHEDCDGKDVVYHVGDPILRKLACLPAPKHGTSPFHHRYPSLSISFSSTTTVSSSSSVSSSPSDTSGAGGRRRLLMAGGDISTERTSSSGTCTNGANGSPCQNSGSATGTSGSCSCSCQSGYMGNNCETVYGISYTEYAGACRTADGGYTAWGSADVDKDQAQQVCDADLNCVGFGYTTQDVTGYPYVEYMCVKKEGLCDKASSGTAQTAITAGDARTTKPNKCAGITRTFLFHTGPPLIKKEFAFELEEDDYLFMYVAGGDGIDDWMDGNRTLIARMDIGSRAESFTSGWTLKTGIEEATSLGPVCMTSYPQDGNWLGTQSTLSACSALASLSCDNKDFFLYVNGRNNLWTDVVQGKGCLTTTIASYVNDMEAKGVCEVRERREHFHFRPVLLFFFFFFFFHHLCILRDLLFFLTPFGGLLFLPSF